MYASTAPDRPPRITVLDSYTDPGVGLFELAPTLPAGSQLVPVYLQTQKAQECMIYSMATARKIADHRNAVDSLHTASDARVIGGVSIHKTISGPDVLPLAFFKHSQSRKTLDRLAEVGKESGRHAAHSDAVNSSGKTIFQRWDENRVRRPDPNDSSNLVTYSASIEPKRLEFIDQSIKHFGAHPSA